MRMIPEFDKALRAVFAKAPTRRRMPGADLPEAEFSLPKKSAMSRR
jgi:ubiquinone biosynthesis monooxygenase Coq7